MSLWSVSALSAVMGATRKGFGRETVEGIAIDSRAISAGDAFFAIKGDVHDGHAFVAKALEAGASVAVVSREWAQHAPNGHYLVVDDVLEGLRRVGIAARARTKAKIIAVTGSVGKTSTKEALRTVLSPQGRTHAAVASFNNHWGVPLTLARMPADTEYGIFEIGMNHAGEIEPLVKMVRPHVAIITNVEGVHLAYFNSIDEIADAKAEIFSGLEPGGTALVNRDSAHFAHLVRRAYEAGAANIYSFGEGEGAGAHLNKLVTKPDCSVVDATILKHDITYKLGAAGKHLAINSLAVLAAVVSVGADLARAAMALGEVEAVKGRGQRLILHTPTGPATLIDESYNANPVSMRAALAVLGAAEIGPQGRRIAVLGDMLELGPESDALHAALLDAMKPNRVDLVFCSGPSMHALWEALPKARQGFYAPNAAELQPKVLAAVKAGDVLMVKGSNGSRMAPIVAALAEKFGDKPAN